MLVSQLNNNRVIKRHWMTELVWEWHIVFTDHMSTLIPRVAIDDPFFIRCSKCNALGHWTRSQGPPSITRLKDLKGDSNTIEGA